MPETEKGNRNAKKGTTSEEGKRKKRLQHNPETPPHET